MGAENINCSFFKNRGRAGLAQNYHVWGWVIQFQTPFLFCPKKLLNV